MKFLLSGIYYDNLNDIQYIVRIIYTHLSNQLTVLLAPAPLFTVATPVNLSIPYKDSNVNLKFLVIFETIGP